jgi:arylsulfatase
MCSGGYGRGFSWLERAVSLLVLAAGLRSSDVYAQERPNIVLILVDDMGFSDIGAYGSEIPTPNLDRLAANGLRFTRFYNGARCCPSRASLLTGLYPHQAGIGHMLDKGTARGYLGCLSDESVTLAEVLQSAGYLTAMTGKWHVGFHQGVTPQKRGFEQSLNFPGGGVYFMDPEKPLYLNGEQISYNDSRLPGESYSTDLWTWFSVQCMDKALEQKKPLFLYLAHVAPHFPLQASAEDIARFKGRYMVGWEPIRQQRHRRQVESGLISKDWKMEDLPSGLPDWDALSLSEKDRYDSLMAVYAAVISRLDTAIGEVTGALEERGMLDNTLILFMSDNGGNAESGPPWHPDPRGSTIGDPTTADSYWLSGQAWAYAQNTPFRLYKHYTHEGGISSPLIAHWPARIGESRTVRTPAHLIDIMPTLVEVSGAKYPTIYKQHQILPMEGQSLMPLLSGTGELPDRTLFWEHEWNAAVRRGDLKLVRSGRNQPWELYNIAEDRTEQHDLSKQMPETVETMKAAWKEWAGRAYIFPKK